MDYHSHRFQDASLMVFKGEKLIALLPANRVEDKVFSHQGLTYGGLLFPVKISGSEAYNSAEAVCNHFKNVGVKCLTVKLLPRFYQKQPADELEYFLLKHGASVEKSHMVLAVDYSKPFSIHKTKLKHFRNNKYGFKIEETTDFKPFWNQVLIPRLAEKHDAKPVHSLDEINLLKTRFLEQIKQFNIYLEGEILAGITILETETTVKSQYGATSKKGEKTRALDYLFLHLIYKYQAEGKLFFSMGTVTENNASGFNSGLLKQKEELGCKIYAQNVLKLNL